MKATEILMSEHTVIERVLFSLQNAVKAAQNGQEVQPDFFLQAADFISGFADGCHHRKEENVLFKALNATGVPAQAGPVSVMLSDHERGRFLTRRMRAGAERWKAGDQAGKAETLQAAAEYTTLLHQHIFKENNILFPMADLIIPYEQQAQVAEDFEKVEHEETGEGIHEKYLGIAQQLESAAAGWK